MKFVKKTTQPSQSARRQPDIKDKRLELTRYYKAPAGDEPVRLSVAAEDGRRSWLVRLAIVGVGLLVAWLLLGLHQIEVVPIKTDALQSASDYTQAINTELKTPPLHIKFLFNTTDQTNRLMAKYPEITNVIWTNPVFGTTATVRVDIRPAQFVLESSKGTYIVNDQGKVIGALANAISTPSIKIIDQTGFDIGIGKNVISSIDAEFLNTLVVQLAAKGITVESLILPPLAQEVHVKADKPYIIKFSFNSDPLQAAGSYIALRQRLVGEQKQPIEYIDVRAGERIFIK